MIGLITKIVVVACCREQALDRLQVDVAELVDPKVMDGGGELAEVVGGKCQVALGDAVGEPGQHPPVHQGQLDVVGLQNKN